MYVLSTQLGNFKCTIKKEKANLEGIISIHVYFLNIFLLFLDVKLILKNKIKNSHSVKENRKNV